MGSGEPLLVIHGIFGGCDAGMVSFDDLLDDRRVVAPSRFGYLGSTVPTGATPALQADVFVELLNHLGMDQVDVMGYSAGSTSAIQLALRHPQRPTPRDHVRRPPRTDRRPTTCDRQARDQERRAYVAGEADRLSGARSIHRRSSKRSLADGGGATWR